VRYVVAGEVQDTTVNSDIEVATLRE
jgi:hypothetical protein